MVDPRHGDNTATETTADQLRRIAAGDLGGRLHAELARWHPQCSHDEIDDAIQTACNYAAGGGCDGTSEGAVYTWLRITAHRWLQRELATRRELPVDPASNVLDNDRRAASAEQQAIELADARDGQALVERVIAALSDRQRTILALHLAGRNRPQIAAQLALTDRTVKREIERIMATARAELGELAGGGCDDGEPLVVRLACGLADNAQAIRARVHLASCDRCADLSRALEGWREKAGALLPLPATETARPGIVERAVHGAADGLARAKQQLADTAAGLRQGVVDGGAQLKQQAGATYYRALDPTPLAGARPGAAATVIAGCLAIGGGASYCAQQGLDPLDAATGLIAPDTDRDRPKAKTRPADKPPPVETVATPPPAPAPDPEPAPAPAPAPEPEPEPTPQPISPTPAPPTGSDSLSGLSGDPTAEPAPAQPNSTDFGGL